MEILFCWILRLYRFRVHIASVLALVIEHSERIGDTHKYEPESDKGYHEDRSSGTEVFLCPVPPPGPTVDHFPIFQDTETHTDPEKRVDYFDEEHKGKRERKYVFRLYDLSDGKQMEK